MKTRIISISVVLLFFTSCIKFEEKESKAAKDSIPTVKREQPVMQANRECFLWTNNKDSVIMHYTRKGDNVSGELRYLWFEKDKSNGTFVGVFASDTLRADYKFQSEGMTSLREIIFVRKGNTLVQGNGDMEEKAKKMVFTNPRKLSFDNSIVITKTDCPK